MANAFLLQNCFDKLRIATPELQHYRCLSLSATHYGKRNFRKFSLGNKRGTRLFKKQRTEGMFPDMPVYSAVRPIGYKLGRQFITVPEMIPELIVPDLENCDLKPYVSYRTPKIAESPFTAQDLFDAVYSKKIQSDFEHGKISEDGQPENPSEEEKLTAEDAFIRAKMTGSDMHTERETKYWEFLDIKLK